MPSIIANIDFSEFRKQKLFLIEVAASDNTGIADGILSLYDTIEDASLKFFPKEKVLGTKEEIILERIEYGLGGCDVDVINDDGHCWSGHVIAENDSSQSIKVDSDGSKYVNVEDQDGNVFSVELERIEDFY